MLDLDENSLTQRSACQLAAVQGGLLAMFEDFCQRSEQKNIRDLMSSFKENRIALVLTVSATRLGADFICCAMPVNGSPDDLIQLFTINTIPSKAH